MTWDELNEKYPEARDEMSADRKRDFLKDNCLSQKENGGNDYEQST